MNLPQIFALGNRLVMVCIDEVVHYKDVLDPVS